jgi:hypothetical protein
MKTFVFDKKQKESSNNLKFMDLVIKHIDFEYDSETKEWCAFFA